MEPFLVWAPFLPPLFQGLPQPIHPLHPQTRLRQSLALVLQQWVFGKSFALHLRPSAALTLEPLPKDALFPEALPLEALRLETLHLEALSLVALSLVALPLVALSLVALALEALSLKALSLKAPSLKALSLKALSLRSLLQGSPLLTRRMFL